MGKKRKLIIWIVDDEKSFRHEAGSVVHNEINTFSTIDVTINEWEGRGNPRGDPADIIILDLDLGDYGTGLNLLPRIPGATHDSLFGPFIIIWSRYAYRYQIYDALKKNDLDRTAITQHKTTDELEKAFRGFMKRFLNEGVLHD